MIRHTITSVAVKRSLQWSSARLFSAATSHSNPEASAGTDVSTRLKNDLKEFMRSGDKKKVTVIKSLLSDVTYAVKSPQGLAEAGGVEGVIQKALKKRADSALAYKEGGREDLAAAENEEMAIIQSYLPRQLTDSEIEELVRAAAARAGATTAKDIGKLMKELNKSDSNIEPGSVTKKALADAAKKVLLG